MHLIRFPNMREHRRAIMALLEVPRECLGLPDYQMVVTEDHIRALKEAGIHFVYLSRQQRRRRVTHGSQHGLHPLEK